MRAAVLLLIRGYQKTVSPDHSALGKKLYKHGYCMYTPSCSEYTYRAVNRYGAVRGLLKGGWRVLRCNPFARGGDDPLT